MMKTATCLLLVFANAHAAVLRMGFLGDTNDGTPAALSYKIMRDFDVDIVLQNGDFDYDSDPEAWDKFLEDNWYAFGINDVLVTSGNHEADPSSTVNSGGIKWEGKDGYKERMYNRLKAGSTLGLMEKCHGRQGKKLDVDYGNFMSCELDGILILSLGWDQISGNNSGPGGQPDAVYKFIEDNMSQSNAIWKIVQFHRPLAQVNGGDRHLGRYDLESIYNLITRYGGLIFSGHSHVYSRTKLLRDFETMEISTKHKEDHIELDCGHAVSFVVGFGGTSLDRPGKYANRLWMQKSYTRSAGNAKNGVLACKFKVNEGPSNENSAECWFYVDQGEEFDHFTISPPPPSTECNAVATISPTIPPDAPQAGASSCLRSYARGWALGNPSKYSWCGNSCCAAGNGGSCYYTVPNPAECGDPYNNKIVSSRVRQSIDDVEIYTGPRDPDDFEPFYYDSSDIEIVDDQGRDGQIIALRFQKVEIPPNAEITTAYLVFEVDEATSGEATGFSIYAEKSTNSKVFSEVDPPNQRPTTTEFVKWNNVEPWTYNVNANTYKLTIPFPKVIQEVISQSGWESENSITIIIKDGKGRRVAKSYDGTDTGAPLLVITYKDSSNVKVFSAIGAGVALGGAALLLGVRNNKKKRLSVEKEALSLPQVDESATRKLSL